MFSIVLFEPEIPPNTGNIIRLCANTGCDLHLIEPLGFELEEKQLKRAGLDYHEYASLQTWPDFDRFCAAHDGRLISFSTRDSRKYSDFDYQRNDAFIFGAETRGLPQWIRDQIPSENRLTIPMQPHSRSLNLANSVSVVVYEAWRQHAFG